MRPPPNGGSRCPRPEEQRPRRPTNRTKPQRRELSATPAIRSRIAYRTVRLQDEAAYLASQVADVAQASDDRAWAEAATHLLSATCSLWLAAEALADWGIAA
jgi:hypothetical protein